MKHSTPQTPAVYEPKTLLLIGPPGGGKTSFMLRFPRLGVVNIDRGLDAPERWLRRIVPDLSYAYETPDFDSKGVPRDTGDIWPAAMNAVQDMIKEPDLDWVAFDGLTMANFYLIAHLLKKHGKVEMTQDLWIPFRAEIIKLLNTIKKSGKNFILTCHEETDNDRAGNITRRKPLIDSKLREALGGWFADIWRCTAWPGPNSTTKFQVDTRPDSINDLKCSYPNMKPQVVIDLTQTGAKLFDFQRDVLANLA